MYLPINLLILLVAVAFICMLQFKLSRSDGRFPGLVLPAVTLLYSLFAVAGMISFLMIQSPQMEINGQIIQEAIYTSDIGHVIWTALFTFIQLNIPTFILGAIYLSERKKISCKTEIEKMRIQDL